MRASWFRVGSSPVLCRASRESGEVTDCAIGEIAWRTDQAAKA
jgi:hypothetical protein